MYVRRKKSPTPLDCERGSNATHIAGHAHPLCYMLSSFRDEERETKHTRKDWRTYIDSSVPHVMHAHCGIVVGVRGGHVLRHHGAHPVDESLRRVLALHATHRHRTGCFRSAGGSRSRSNLGDVVAGALRDTVVIRVRLV